MIRPEEVVSDESKRWFILLCPSNLKDELTLIELDKKKIKKKGRYIGISSSVIGRKIRTDIKINLKST